MPEIRSKASLGVVELTEVPTGRTGRRRERLTPLATSSAVIDGITEAGALHRLEPINSSLSLGMDLTTILTTILGCPAKYAYV